ncbi:MAG: serine hydrolase domain-containing protein [Candidatus Sulfotelmatobacter sp.]
MTSGKSVHSSSLLPASFEHQDERFATAFSILQKAIADRVFPAASVAVAHAGKLVALKAFGHFTYDPDDRATEQTSGTPGLADFARRGNSPVHSTTLFDLASLTKVIATTPLAMILYERGLLDLDAPVAAVVPEFLADLTKDPRRKTITLRMLLSHSSGLPAYEKLFQKTKTRDELLHAAVTTPLTVNPGIRALYSDIGFIILSIALERLADESLDRFCQREIFSPLAMTNTTFNPPAEIRAQIPPTADEREDFAGESSCGADTPVRQMPRVQPMQSESCTQPEAPGATKSSRARSRTKTPTSSAE